MAGLDLPAIATQAAQDNGLDPQFFLSLIGDGEGGFANSGRSPKGAIGPAQLMPGTARDMGVRDITDPAQNLYGGARYAKMLWDKYGGDPKLTAAAYNAGPGAVDKYGGVPPFKETQAYVARVTGSGATSGGDNLPNPDDVMKAYGWAPAAAPEMQPIASSHNGGVGIGLEPKAAATPDVTAGMPSPDDVMKAYGWKAPPAAQPAPPAQPQGIMPAVEGFMANVNRGSGIGDELAAAANAAGSLSGKFLSGQRILDTNDLNGSLDRAWNNQFAASLARQRQVEAAYGAAHPNMAALAQGTGLAATAAIPAGDSANVFAQGGRLTNALRGAVTTNLAGAAFAGADAGTPQERLKAASDAALNPFTAALGAAGGALARGAPRQPVTAPSNAATLAQAGVPLTAGQMGGPLAHRLEDAAESLPLTGAAIRARKLEGLQGFDRAAINEALSPIGQQVDAHGREAIGQANQHISDAYNTALGGVTVTPDAQFQADLNAITNDARLPASVRRDVADAVNEFVVNPLSADDTGASWKRIDSDLNTLSRAAGNAVGTTPQSLSLQRALNRVQDAHWSLLERQAPDAADAVANADAANAAMERVRAAAASTGTAGRDGLFTASDLNRAVATKGGRSGRRAYGQGTALMQGLSDAGQAVLPSTVPDSGTALRAFITKLAAGGGALAGIGEVGGHAVAVPAALAGGAADLGGAVFYSRPVQEALRRAYLARLAGSPAGVLSGPAAARLSRAAGVAGARASANPFAQPAPATSN